MKKVVIILWVSLIAFSCKSDSRPEKSVAPEESELITMTGDFIYYADAAVLQTPKEIYGVVIDDKMHELENVVKPLKDELTDMVSVTVKVRRFKKPENEEGWPFRVEIKEILKVEKPDPNKQDVIKLVE
jgi:hypothetical protein